jgi:hypothetical protein
MLKIRRTSLPAFALLLCLCWWLMPSPALAYNFTYVDPDTGTPLGWEPGTTIEYYLDPGDAGALTNEQAHTLLKKAMRIWEEVPYANVPHFEFAGYLPEDVTGDNYETYVSINHCYTSDLESCSTDYYKNLQTMIIFDPDNAILDNEFCRITGCSAHAGPKVMDGDFFHQGTFRQGAAIFGSRLYSNDTSEIVGTFIHELGHLLGLGHPLLNQQLYGNNIEGLDDSSIFLATMDTNLPWNRDDINPDDIAGISVLYPNDRFTNELGSISGEVRKSDGSPMTHANVIARNVADPWCNAYSILSGLSCDGPTTEFCQDYNLADGRFTIGGLPPGSYTLEVEGFEDEDYAFTVAPGLIDPYIPGNAEFWNEGDAASEDPLTYTTIDVAADEEVQDIVVVLNDTQRTDNYTTTLDPSIIGSFDNTACSKSTNDWDALIGREDTIGNPPATTGTAGGCSLIAH